MKRLLIAIVFTAALSAVSVSCSKGKQTYCYACSAISGPTTYHRNVCTEGNPTDGLPTQDANGNYTWSCTKR